MQYFKFYLAQSISEVGKVTLKSYSAEAFNAEKKIVAMKRLTILKIEAFNASSLHRFIDSSLSTLHKSPENKAKLSQHICKGKEDDIFQLCYGKKNFLGNCQ